MRFFLATFLSALLALPIQAEQNPNILLVIVDTLPAHFVSAYDNKSQHTPHLDSLARDGALFTSAAAVSSWTKPTIASIFTSKMPSYHRVTAMADKLPEDEVTIAEYLSNHGYQTAAFVSHTILKKRSGFSQGFKEYQQLNRHKNPHMAVSSKDVSDAALKWLTSRKQEAKKPFFLVLHYFDPHFRYKNHEEIPYADSYRGELKPGMSIERLTKLRSSFSDADINYLKNLFREECAFTDQQIGRVLSYLANNSKEKTLTVMTADHGEEFMEHGSLGHTQTLFNEITRIPLIIHYPGIIPAARYDSAVNQLDILPTVASLARLPVQKAWQGRNLKPLFSSAKIELPARPLFAEVAYRKVSTGGPIFPHLSSVTHEQYKLIIDRGRNKTLLFNLKNDPLEKDNLASAQPERLQKLQEYLQSYEKGVRSHKTTAATNKEEFSSEEIENLKSLGYL